jgi:hypothetical protein
MVDEEVQQEEAEDERVPREEEPPALAVSAARLRQIVAGNEARMRQLDQFVRRLDELLQKAARLYRKGEAGDDESAP